ncbi:Crp/Fnr family transcriptional regulator [Rhodoblastus acidophilus]|uniref:Crp/Fnr family transcriptional regulator n=1 Tax=Candidatus Rhodoblastus alkanivorans TaxID=2954117 RepID=A0ABS9Z991_9HYPH|nr:Crp/Fnr family transcriptional regulator [Candidatus Rhodoblastus alkanivorans]MCI4678858.1 Crp/Fnr family transcriptional regulator [Candidatus Rhodoblastus alkanivorans]MCI4684218.1 Crp/Fnr family transcriptional regulator [Candidatus Rhodoblastus alkanivorans]MDI4641539.1 Crp/Fnr family transcriptional regulator [Rhodoblastus acidophilus]
MNGKSIDILGVLKSCSVFATLTEAQRRELVGKARIEHYSERTLLTLRGELPDHIRYIASGSIDIVLSTAEGGFSSLPMLEGRWATWLGCFGSEPLVHDLWSSNNATYVAIPCRDVNKAVANNPEALLEVIEHVGEWTRFLTGWMLSFAAYGPEKRLVYLLLLASSDACAITQEGQETAVTQTHISQFGFGSRQKVSRLLRGLADKGLIEMRYGAVIIPSRARLHAYIADDNVPASAPRKPARRLG